MNRAIFLAMTMLLALTLAGCGAPPDVTPPPPVTVEVPVVETQVVVETRVVAQTVVVTATPIPTPSYVSRINAPAETLVYPLTGDPETLDPQQASDEQSGLVVEQLYEGLFRLQADGQVIPAAAEGYQVSPDGKTYTVTLRSGLTWSDGLPLTAQHYVDGVCRLLEPATGNPYYYLLSETAGISGARAFAGGEIADCKTVGVAAADDRTLRITLDRPISYFPKLLAFRTFLPHRADLGEPGRVTNGPYTLDAWTPGEKLTLVKNSRYRGDVESDRIEFPIIADAATQLALYEKGDLHVAEFPAAETARIQADPAFARELKVLVQPGTSYLGVNTQITPTLDVNVRRAIASAIDRDALIRDVLKQPWRVPARTIVPPSVPGYQGDDATVGYAYDPVKARELLTQAGYGDGKPPPPVELWYNREGNNEALFRAIGGMLEAVGIPVRLSSSSWNVHRSALEACSDPAKCSYNLYRMGWVMDYADPSSLLDGVFSPASAFQYTGWKSDAYDKLLAEARAEPNETKRLELYKQAEKLLLNEAAVAIPLLHYDRTLLVKDGVTFDFPPIGAPALNTWKLPG